MAKIMARILPNTLFGVVSKSFILRLHKVLRGTGQQRARRRKLQAQDLSIWQNVNQFMIAATATAPMVNITNRN
jgi:hypothetical protein